MIHRLLARLTRLNYSKRHVFIWMLAGASVYQAQEGTTVRPTSHVKHTSYQFRFWNKTATWFSTVLRIPRSKTINAWAEFHDKRLIPPGDLSSRLVSIVFFFFLLLFVCCLMRLISKTMFVRKVMFYIEKIETCFRDQ